MDASEQPEPPSATWMGALRGLGTTLLRLLHTRLELLGIELKEEKAAFATLFLCAGAILFFGVMAAICATAAVVWFCPAQARGYVLAGFCALYAGAAVLLVRKLRRELRDRPPPFASTVNELKKDAQWLRTKS